MPPTDNSAPLGLVSVVVGSLPSALLTDLAPDRYLVEAVFSRRPHKDEITQILGTETAAYLAGANYPHVVLTVTDRRLGISPTNLQELTDGLATVLATRLADISEEVRARDEAAAARSADLADHALARATAIARLADAVTFTPADAFPHNRGTDPTLRVAPESRAAENGA